MRQHSELISLFGRAEVERASVRCDELNQWINSDLSHRFEVIRAMQGLQEAIAIHPHNAVSYCRGLEPNVRGAILLDLLELL
jgi:hypothetical protein